MNGHQIRELRCCLFLVSIALLGAGDAAFAELKVSTDFVGGSVVVVEQNAEKNFLHIQPTVLKDRGFPCRWFLKVSGLTAGEMLTLKVSGNPQAFRGERVLSANWSMPDRAAISTDNVNWRQTPPGQREQNSINYQIKIPAETVWLAWGPPYLPAHADALLATAQEKLPTAEVFQLAETRQGRSVKGIRFGAKPSDRHRPYGIWIQARQHAWEAGGSWVAHGFLQWATSDEPSAIEFRKLAETHLIPIMDVDSVAVGAGGKDAVPRDHNRDWDQTPHYPEVAAAQQKILQLERESRFDLFVDLHNPAPNDRKPFFFGPVNMETLPAIQQRNYTRWIAYAHDHIEQLHEKYRFATYVKTDEERNRMSANWVRNHTSPHVMSITLETAWNRPEGTQQGYQTVGRQLGLSLLRYLESQPRHEDPR